MFYFFKKTSAAFLIIFLLATSFVAFATPQTAQADVEDELQKMGEACAASAAAQTLISLGLSAIQGTSVPVADLWQTFKESFLDCIAWGTATVLIQELTNSMVAWAQSGFNGNPAFVENPEQFLGDVRKQTIDVFVDELNNELGGLLCSPYKKPIIQAIIRINTPSRFERDIQCTLDEAVANLEGFLEGDFSQGGWDGWIKLVNNNPYSEFIAVERELDRRVASAVGTADRKLLWGEGFMSWERQTCYAYNEEGSAVAEFDINDTSIEEVRASDPSAVSYECDPAQVKTPGSVIETQLNDQLGSSRRRFEVADDFNEIISQLMYWLVYDILNDEEGLAGYNPDESERNPSFELPPFELPPELEPGGGCSGCDGADDTPPGPAGPNYTFVMQGSFNPTEPHTQRFVCKLDPPRNVHYDRIRASWDVDVDDWGQGNNPQAFRHDFFSLTRGGRWRDNFGYIPFEKGGSGDGIVLRHGVNLEHGNKAKTRQSTSLPTGSYHVDYLFDAKTGVVEAVVTKPGGETVRISQPMQGWPGSGTGALVPLTSVNVGNNSFYSGFSFIEGEASAAEAPSYGATFRNLTIEFEADDSSGAPVTENESCSLSSGGVEGPEPEDPTGGGSNPNPTPSGSVNPSI